MNDMDADEIVRQRKQSDRMPIFDKALVGTGIALAGLAMFFPVVRFPEPGKIRASRSLERRDAGSSRKDRHAGHGGRSSGVSVRRGADTRCGNAGGCRSARYGNGACTEIGRVGRADARPALARVDHLQARSRRRRSRPDRGCQRHVCRPGRLAPAGQQPACHARGARRQLGDDHVARRRLQGGMTRSALLHFPLA